MEQRLRGGGAFNAVCTFLITELLEKESPIHSGAKHTAVTNVNAIRSLCISFYCYFYCNVSMHFVFVYEFVRVFKLSNSLLEQFPFTVY